jgi:hypothetical protein
MADIYTVAQTYDNSGNAIVASRVPANNFKTVQRTQFGTRELSVIKVLVGGTNASMILVDGSTADVGGVVGHTMTNSLFSAAVRNLQIFGEVFAVYTPALHFATAPYVTLHASTHLSFIHAATIARFAFDFPRQPLECNRIVEIDSSALLDVSSRTNIS